MPQSLKELLWGWELDQSIPKQIGLIKLIKFLPKRKNNTQLKFVCSKAYTDQILHLVIYSLWQINPSVNFKVPKHPFKGGWEKNGWFHLVACEK